MSETTNPLAALRAMESGAFRLGQFTRKLLADHADTAFEVRTAGAYGYDHGHLSLRLELRAATLDAASVLAAALGVELAETHNAGEVMVFRYLRGTGRVDDIEVEITALHRLPDAEAAQWRLENPAPAGGDS